MRYALLIVDMLNDFVTGKLKCERVQRIIPNVRRLADAARAAEVPVIYGNDAHLPEDFELKIWGAHAMKGTPGAQTIPALREQKGDQVLGKRTYSAFYETPLDTVLRAHDVTHLAITGLHTNICCRHTSADAFFRGYVPVLPEDGVDSLTEQAHRDGLEYIKTMYQAEVTSSDKLLRKWK